MAIKPDNRRIEMITVNLKSCGNPDYDQFAPISNPEKVIVNTITEAQDECRKYIKLWNLGGGNWNGGQLYVFGKKIGHIAYNGRFITNQKALP